MMSSLFPGAGQFMLGNKTQGQGIFSSVGLMMLYLLGQLFKLVVVVVQ